MKFDTDSDTDIVVQQYEKKRMRKYEQKRMRKYEKKTMTMTMKKKKKKKKVRAPPELKVLKRKGMDMDMNAEELLERYFLPNTPLESWYFEEEFGIRLDQPLFVDGPPPCPPRPLVASNSQTAKDLEVLLALRRYKRAASDYLRKNPNLKPYSDATTIKVGDSVDIKSLLFPFLGDYLVRRKGRGRFKAKDVVNGGKYVMVCCCYAPALGGSSLWMAVHGCSEMYSKLYGKFEMVVVIKARPGWSHPRAREKDVFRRTFSVFPRSCLAVPFHDRSRQHNICSSVGLIDDPKVLLVGPDGKALLSTDLNLGVRPLHRYPLVPLDVNGSDSTPFPFIKNPDNISPPSSLKGLLFHSCESVFRKKIMPAGAGAGGSNDDVSFIKEEVSLSDLNSKPIALYLYDTGEKLPMLRYIAQGCSRQTNKDLEVVVVCLHTDRNSPSFPEYFSTALAKRGLPWWVVPYNFSASILLDQIFEVALTWERVIIIGPNDQYVDFRGLRFMQIYGVSAYPFTFQSVVQKIVQELSQVTLDTFFELLQIQDYPPPGKKALLYFDFPESISISVFKEAIRLLSYEEVQLHFISLVDNESFGRHAMNLDPKHTEPFDFTLALLWHTEGVDKMNNFFLRLFNSRFPTIVAFGEDGRICSLLAHELPPFDGLEIKGNLLEEVSSMLEKFLKTFDRMDFLDDVYVHGHALLQELGHTQLS